MLAAFPADHDDHTRRAVRNVAHCSWGGGRRRVTAAAWACRGRRAAGFAVADALHHAGDLSLHGIIPGVATPWQGRPVGDRPEASGSGIAVESPNSPVGAKLASMKRATITIADDLEAAIEA